MSRTILVLFLLPLSFSVAKDAQGMVSPYSWRVIRGLAQSSDVLVVGQTISEVAGRHGEDGPDGTWIPTTDTRLRVRVIKTLAGRAAPEIDVLFSAADTFKVSLKQGQLLFFLRREGDSFRLTFWKTHGVFRIRGGRAMIWLQGSKRGRYHPVATFAKLMRREQRRRVTRRVALAPAGKRDVALTVTFHNTGHLEAIILPPSWTFNSIVVNRIRGGKWHSSLDPRHSVDHWEFLKHAEQPKKLAVGDTLTFQYKIPRQRLGMQARGEYEATVRLNTYRTSSWCKDDTIQDQAPVWLGAVPEQKLRLQMP